ncbi:sugar ABC transporter permease [Cellulomonas sp. JH27-2]|uniref:carbohydrate ABC transporter permease n=1 Tax=Cellulomonas sp. JH27-2 TaxID=2774139 RepID=UPI00177AAE1D|nr:sugar ABC transporter permease [Cellulomonas sp. JH27-2]MBD8060403.1 sugar ABC transporter permease [Cellulomonas sp. JH27-2]
MTSTGTPQLAGPTSDDERVRQQRRVGFSQRLGRWDVKVSPYLYISPFFILFIVVGLFPLLYTGYVSFHKWDLLTGKGDSVGFENFDWVLHSDMFWKSVRNTFSIFLLSSVPQVIIALVLAAILDANLRAKTFWRMGVLVPYVVAPVAVSLIFGQLFADQSGTINAILAKVGIDPILWHSHVLPSHIAIATMVNFRWTGYNTLIFLAAMQAIPRDLYEAALIDGAKRVRQFFSITIPMLRPTMIFIVVTSTIGGLQIFDEPRMFDQAGRGGADQQYLTVTNLIYQLGWTNRNFGRASAVAWILFLMILVISLINYLLSRRISSDETAGAKKRKKVRA